jgi:hypothetical protein
MRRRTRTRRIDARRREDRPPRARRARSLALTRLMQAFGADLSAAARRRR